MGQTTIKSSSSSPQSQNVRSMFNFTGIKEIAKHPYISCLCSQNEPTYQSSPDSIPIPHSSSNKKNRNSRLSKHTNPLHPSNPIDSRHSLHYGGDQSPGLHKSFEVVSQIFHHKGKSYTPKEKTSEFFSNPSNRNSSIRGSKNRPNINLIPEEKTNRLEDFNLSGSNDHKELEGSQAGSQDLKEVVEDQMDSVVREEVFIGNGRRYRGDLLDGKPHGVGKEIWPDGSSYEGMYHFGTRTGEGVFVWPDKSIYRGNFIDNEMQGYGIFEWSNGNKYEGMWNKSKMHGEGKYTWNNDNQYVGYYFDGLKHGDGTFIYHDGRIVKGKWLNGHIQVNMP